MNNDLVCQSNFFEGSVVRTVFHGNELWFSIVDAINAVKNTVDASDYWSTLKKRLSQDIDNIELLTNCRELKLEASDGKFYNTDCMREQDLYELLYEIPSKKTRHFKKFSASLVKKYNHNQLSFSNELELEEKIVNKVLSRLNLSFEPKRRVNVRYNKHPKVNDLLSRNYQNITHLCNVMKFNLDEYLNALDTKRFVNSVVVKYNIIFLKMIFL